MPVTYLHHRILTGICNNIRLKKIQNENSETFTSWLYCQIGNELKRRNFKTDLFKSCCYIIYIYSIVILLMCIPSITKSSDALKLSNIIPVHTNSIMKIITILNTGFLYLLSLLTKRKMYILRKWVSHPQICLNI